MYKKFLYFILEEDGRYLVVKNGVVSSTSKPTPLSNTPDGWQEITLAWERDMKLLGLVRQLSLPFGFVTDAAMILRKAFFDQSLERKLFLVIAKHEPVIEGGFYSHTYKKFYRGEIDNTSFKNSALKIEANVTEGGLHKLFTANRATQYEFPLSEGDASVKLDGIFLSQSHNFLINKIIQKRYHFVDLGFLDKEGEGAGVATFSQFGKEVPFNYDYNNGTDYFLTTSLAITGLRLKGKITVISPTPTSFYRLFLYRTSTGQNVQIGEVTNLQANTPYTIDVDYTFNSTAGEKFYLTGNAYTAFVGVAYLESDLSLSLKSRYRTTYAKAYTPFALYKKLVKAVAGKEDYAFSNLLLQYNHLKLTSGDGLRSIEGAKIKTSLDNFFDFCYVQMFAGIGVEGGKIRIEERGHFLNYTNPIALGEAKNVEITEATDLLFNTVEVGYNPVQTDDVNGKFSFNNKFTYGTHITRINKAFQLICPYIADPFVIELTRINLEGKTTTDDKSDNQVFILDAPLKELVTSIAVTGGQVTVYNYSNADDFKVGDPLTISGAGAMNGTYTILQSVESSGTVILQVSGITAPGNYSNAKLTLSIMELYRSPTMTITGVPDPASIFNIRLSPKRILLKWMPWINSILYREAGNKLTFITTDKNADIVTTEGGVTIAEKASVTIGTERLFIAKEISFENMVPSSLANQLESDPSSAFSFVWQGVTYTGFIRKAGMAPNDEKEQTFKLLSAPTNDFKNLIHG